MQKKKRITQCESCAYYDYDEDVDAYVCGINLEEDDLVRYYQGSNSSCPYYSFYDEYKIVQKQN